jgi:RNA polymerase sigma factor (sigma-70 family)
MMTAFATLDVFAHHYIAQVSSRLCLHAIGDPAVTGDDLRQELYLSLLRGLGRFDPQRGAWTTFVRTVVDHAAIDLVRQFRRPTLGRSIKPALRLQQVPSTDRPAILHPFDVDEMWHGRRTGHWPSPPAERIDLRTDVESMLTRLSPRDRKLCGLLAVKSAVETAATLEIARSTLYERISALRRTFEDHGLSRFL